MLGEFAEFNFSVLSFQNVFVYGQGLWYLSL